MYRATVRIVLLVGVVARHAAGGGAPSQKVITFGRVLTSVCTLQTVGGCVTAGAAALVKK